MDEYNLIIEDDVNFYMMICKGMYSLKEADILAFTNLVKNMAPYDYSPMKYTPFIWRHNTRKRTFTLFVDDYGKKYFLKDDAHYLIDALKANYKFNIYWTRILHIGIKLDWQYTASPAYVDLSMKGFVDRAQTKFDHPIPQKTQHALHPWTAPIYGHKTS